MSGGELRSDQFHPAARSAYRWLKGFMVTNRVDYRLYVDAMELARADGNLQAEVCLGTIERLRAGQPVSDRYLLGLAWTILSIHNHDALEAVARARIDPAYDSGEDEFTFGRGAAL